MLVTVSRAGSRVARSKLPHFGWPWEPKRVAWISIIFLVLGVAGYSVAIAQTGGVGIFLSTLQGRSLLEQSGIWFLASTLVLIHSATVILGTYLFKTGKRKFFFLASLFLSVAASLLLGGNTTVMIYLLSLVVIFYQLRYDDAKRSLPFTVMIGVLYLLPLFLLWDWGMPEPTSRETVMPLCSPNLVLVRSVIDSQASSISSTGG